MRQRLSFLVVSACGVRAFCSIVTGPVCGVLLWAAFVSGVGLTAARAHLVGFERDLPSRTLVGWGGEMGRGVKGNPTTMATPSFGGWRAGPSREELSMAEQMSSADRPSKSRFMCMTFTHRFYGCAASIIQSFNLTLPDSTIPATSPLNSAE